VAFSPDGTALAAATEPGVRRLGRATSKERFAVKLDVSVRAWPTPPTAKYLATGGRDGAVNVWDAECGT